MMGSHHFTRVDILELKDLIYQKVGQQRAQKYFDHLNRFLGSKLSKADFNKGCIQTLGQENIALHNRLIKSIIQNGSQAKVPPQKAAQKVGTRVANGYQRNCMKSLYGDAFPQSPRKCRSPISKDRKFRERPSPLGPLGKSPSITFEETVTRTQEQLSLSELHSRWEDGEEVEQSDGTARLPIAAPFGISVKMGGAWKSSHSRFSFSGFTESCQNSGVLPDTTSLRSCLEKKLESEGVGISMDAANLLNRGLDVFLKRLIEPCIGIARSRCPDPRVLGREWYDGMPGQYAPRQVQLAHASMLDFRVAMESNPSVLGKDWSTQLDKICHYHRQ